MLIFVVTSVIHCKMMKKSCFTSTETVGLLGTGAQDGHLDFHTAPASSEWWYSLAWPL